MVFGWCPANGLGLSHSTRILLSPFTSTPQTTTTKGRRAKVDLQFCNKFEITQQNFMDPSWLLRALAALPGFVFGREDDMLQLVVCVGGVSKYRALEDLVLASYIALEREWGTKKEKSRPATWLKVPRPRPKSRMIGQSGTRARSCISTATRIFFSTPRFGVQNVLCCYGGFKLLKNPWFCLACRVSELTTVTSTVYYDYSESGELDSERTNQKINQRIFKKMAETTP